MGTRGYARTDSLPLTADRPARASKPCARLGSTPAILMSSGGSAPSCRCSCGRTSPIFRWANIGNPPPIERTLSMCCPAASRCFGVFAEVKLLRLIRARLGQRMARSTNVRFSHSARLKCRPGEGRFRGKPRHSSRRHLMAGKRRFRPFAGPLSNRWSRPSAVVPLLAEVAPIFGPSGHRD